LTHRGRRECQTQGKHYKEGSTILGKKQRGKNTIKVLLVPAKDSPQPSRGAAIKQNLDEVRKVRVDKGRVQK